MGIATVLADELKVHHGRLSDGVVLSEAADCIVNMVKEFDNNGVRLPEASIEVCWNMGLRFLNLTEAYEDQLIPKRHLLLHMLRALPVLGNPSFYSSWKDESNNKLLKLCCRKVSQSTFEISVLSAMRSVLAKQPRCAKMNRDVD